jgi:DNA-binding transcriptional LysR family regulator
VRITAPILLGATVSNVVYTFLAKHPGVSIDLVLDERRGDLLDEGYDLAIHVGKVDDSTDFVARGLWQSSRKLLYASPRYLQARGTPRRVEDLARHDCVAMHAADGFATWTLVRGSRRQRVTVAPRFYVNEFSAAHRAVLAGLGIAMMPEVHCARDVAEKRLVRVLDGYEGESGGVQLLYRAHRSLTAAVRACIDHFIAELPASDPTRAGHKGRA